MYLGFNLNIEDNFSSWYDKGNEIYNEQFHDIEMNLKKYLYDGTEIYNGNSVANEWFPEVEADVFLSHSHMDKNKAIGFAGWLHEKFNLTVFIDSCIWGYANDLLKMIDDEHCLNIDKTMYDYNKRNYSTSHVHMMLSMALTKMMDKAEIVVFMNTENSVQPVTSTISQATKSPWLYSELVLTNFIRKNIPSRKIPEYIEKRALEESTNLELAYPVNEFINQLHSLYKGDLMIWEREFLDSPSPKGHSLDYLYAQLGESY